MGFDFTSVLSQFGVDFLSGVTKTAENVWIINDVFVLKSDTDHQGLDRCVRLCGLLLSERLPVVEYIDTTFGMPYVFWDNQYWCLMKKMQGSVFDPYIGCPKRNGFMLGEAVAALHRSLKRAEYRMIVPVADFHNDFITWILPELSRGGISFVDGLIDRLHSFVSRDYHRLPRQLIHRDMHVGNLLFNDGTFSYLDFMLCQQNVRLFDLVYLGCSLLAGQHQDEERLKQWRVIFSGILGGYRSFLPLTDEEMKAIPSLFLFDEVLFTAFYHRIGNPDSTADCVAMTNWLMTYTDRIFEGMDT